ncbi:tight adherence protein B [Roseovarius azorensis]|uniref:Tight adherence protein B n=1 Tax=Roseovarius azorensis TaxID=1287727 RepID=A0A1H7N607_9RHOB|nr:type II secretion system F family protein [Roseovarius azorensis]SEL18930.1 tight adherence protein B [Roseovarius azorensis]
MTDILSRVDPGWLLFVGVFLGALLLIEGMRQLLSRRETNTEARSRRMRMVAAGTDVAERLSALAPRQAGEGGSLAALMTSVGLSRSPALYVVVALLCAAALTAMLLQLIGLIPAIVTALSLFVLLPLLIMMSIRDARRQKLSAQLPDALDLMARGLRAGHPLNTSIATVAETMPDPIGTEFGILVDQISYGDEMVVAVRKLAERVPTEDFRYLAASIAIQHGTGGNLGRILTVLSQVMRGRAMTRRKIKAMSAEGRVSAVILSCIPFLMVGLNSIITPEYYGGVVGDPLFIPLAFTALTLIALNALVLFKLVNFKF